MNNYFINFYKDKDNKEKMFKLYFLIQEWLQYLIKMIEQHLLN